MANPTAVESPASLIKLGGGTFGCHWCGKVSLEFVAELYRTKSWFMCRACAENTPPRGAQVFRGLPKWFGRALKAGFPGDALVRQPEIFLDRHFHSVFDHAGHDFQGNVVFEPYASNTPELEERLAIFAKRIGVGHSIGWPSWHAPFCSDCIRITLYRPEEAGR